MPAEKRGRVVFLDIARIFACLCILTVHFDASVSGYSGGVFQYPNSVIPYLWFGGLYLGDIGVSLFFIISGAALEYSNPDGCRPLRKFYFRRFLSIYPSFWIAFAVSLSFTLLFSRDFSAPPCRQLLWSIFGMDGYAKTMGWSAAGFYQVGEWYLGCILLIYLVYPLLSAGVHRNAPLTAAVLAAVYALLIRRIPYIWFFLRLPEVMLGMVFIRFIRSPKNTAAWVVTLSALLLRVLLDQYLHPITKTTITCWTVFLSIALLTEYTRGFMGERFRKALEKLSALTYPAFLIHHRLIDIMISGVDLPHLSHGGAWALFLLYLLLTALLSVCLLKLGRALGNRIRTFLAPVFSPTTQG